MLAILLVVLPFSDHRGNCYLRRWIAFGRPIQARELRDADVVVIDLFQILSPVNHPYGPLNSSSRLVSVLASDDSAVVGFCNTSKEGEGIRYLVSPKFAPASHRKVALENPTFAQMRTRIVAAKVDAASR
jgi:hypothetical protein